MKQLVRWGIEWRANPRGEPPVRYILCNGPSPWMFRTKRATSEFIKKAFGYIMRRPDLRSDPHNWLMPIPIRLSISKIEKE